MHHNFLLGVSISVFLAAVSDTQLTVGETLISPPVRSVQLPNTHTRGLIVQLSSVCVCMCCYIVIIIIIPFFQYVYM